MKAIRENGSRREVGPIEEPSAEAFREAECLARTGTWEWDLENDVLVWSKNLYRLVGREPGEITPSPEYVIAITHPNDRARVHAEIEQARRERHPPDITYRVILPNGEVRVLRGATAAVAEESDGRPSRIVGSVQDLTELVEAQRKTAESLNLMETLRSSAPVGFAFIDTEFRIVEVNATLASVNGEAAEEQIGRTIAEVVPEVWTEMEPIYRRVLETGVPVTNLEVERMDTVRGERRHWLASYYPVQIGDEVVGLGIIVNDVSDRVEAERFRSAVMDTIVEGLYVIDAAGRLEFMNSAAERLLGWTEEELCGRFVHEVIHYQCADGSPHPESDCEVLKVLSEGRLVRMERGEAFTRKDGTIFPVGFSAAPLMAGDEVEGVVVVFSDRTQEQAREEEARRELDTLAWVGRIRDAIDHGRLLIYSQRIVPLRGGEPAEELLLRMRGANGEAILPGSFLPVAERYGLVGELDRWVIREAVALAARGKRVEANLSAQSIDSYDLMPVIEQELRATGADPSRLVFEITETALMKNAEAGEAFAHGLHSIGCRIALDDFGTGFGSFTYLKRLPITYVKIDIDFVRDLAENEANRHLVRAIVGLAKDFCYETIAEGVEDAQTLEILKEYGIDYAQGNFLGPPRLS